MLSFAAISEAQNMDAHQALSTKQQRIIPIAAFTANGDMDKLRPALHAGLEVGLTVHEIKEILV
jgi:alkylhydroperoxidase/carboxymuconolactone decarboxylase family protein YurZ